MDQKQSESLVMAMSGGLGAIGLYITILFVIDNEISGHTLLFVACLLSIFMAVVTIVVFLSVNRQLIKISFFLTIGLAILWGIILIIFIVDSDYINKPRLILSIICTGLSVCSAVFHYMAGALSS